MVAYLQHPCNPPLLKPIPNLQFFPDLHRYRWRNQWIPHSISRIAQPLSPEDRANIDRYKDGPLGWEARGNWVHAAAEAKLKGDKGPEDLDLLYQDWGRRWTSAGC